AHPAKRWKGGDCRQTPRRSAYVPRWSHSHGVPAAAGVHRYECGPGLKCPPRQLAPSAVDRPDAGPAPDEQAVGDEPKRSDVDEAPALVDQIGENAVDIRIFARPLTPLLLAVDDQFRPAVFQPHG